MPRRPPLGLVGLVFVVAGCSIGVPTVDGANVASVNGLSANTLLTCSDLKGLLPQSLAAGVAQRTTVPLSDSTVAWGPDPAITLRCGVKAGSPQDDSYTFDGITWAEQDAGTTRSWTTMGLKVNIVVAIPDKYQVQSSLLIAMAPAIKSALK